MSKEYTIRFRTDNLAIVISAIQESGELIDLRVGEQPAAETTPADSKPRKGYSLSPEARANRAKLVTEANDKKKESIIDAIGALLLEHPNLTAAATAMALNEAGIFNLYGNPWTKITVEKYHALALLKVKGIGGAAQPAPKHPQGRPISTPPTR